MNKDAILKQLMKEDKSGLAYCLNHMRGKNSLGYHHYCECLKSELRFRVNNASDEELARLKDFKTYAHLFN